MLQNLYCYQSSISISKEILLFLFKNLNSNKINRVEKYYLIPFIYLFCKKFTNYNFTTRNIPQAIKNQSRQQAHSLKFINKSFSCGYLDRFSLIALSVYVYGFLLYERLTS